MEGVSASRKENQWKGDKKVIYIINVHRKYLGIKIRHFFGNRLKDKYNTKNSVGEESNVIDMFISNLYSTHLINLFLVYGATFKIIIIMELVNDISIILLFLNFFYYEKIFIQKQIVYVKDTGCSIKNKSFGK